MSLDIKIEVEKNDHKSPVKQEKETLKITLNNELTKFDRQIRLFGLSTQLILNHTNIEMILPRNETNYVASEIIKNFKCLGIKTITTNYEESFYTMLDYKDFLIKTDKKNQISNSIQIKIDYKKFAGEKINTDEFMNLTSGDREIEIPFSNETIGFFVCQFCLKFSTEECLTCEAPKSIVKSNIMKINNECLLGAFFVQEVVKMLSGDQFVSYFELKNF